MRRTYQVRISVTHSDWFHLQKRSTPRPPTFSTSQVYSPYPQSLTTPFVGVSVLSTPTVPYRFLSFILGLGPRRLVGLLLHTRARYRSYPPTNVYPSPCSIFYVVPLPSAQRGKISQCLYLSFSRSDLKKHNLILMYITLLHTKSYMSSRVLRQHQNSKLWQYHI